MTLLTCMGDTESRPKAPVRGHQGRPRHRSAAADWPVARGGLAATLAAPCFYSLPDDERHDSQRGYGICPPPPERCV